MIPWVFLLFFRARLIFSFIFKKRITSFFDEIAQGKYSANKKQSRFYAVDVKIARITERREMNSSTSSLTTNSTYIV